MLASGVHDNRVEVTVIGCSKLRDTEWLSRQDPYVYLEYGGTQFRTKTCTDGHVNPIFEEKFVFNVIEGLKEMNVSVWNSNTLTRDDLIGTGKVHLYKALAQGFDDSVWKLQTKKGRSAGELKLIIHYPNAKKLVATPSSAQAYGLLPSPSQVPHHHAAPACPPPPVCNPPPVAASYPIAPPSPYPSHAAAPPSVYPPHPAPTYPSQPPHDPSLSIPSPAGPKPSKSKKSFSIHMHASAPFQKSYHQPPPAVAQPQLPPPGPYAMPMAVPVSVPMGVHAHPHEYRSRSSSSSSSPSYSHDEQHMAPLVDFDHREYGSTSGDDEYGSDSD